MKSELKWKSTVLSAFSSFLLLLHLPIFFSSFACECVWLLYSTALILLLSCSRTRKGWWSWKTFATRYVLFRILWFRCILVQSSLLRLPQLRWKIKKYECEMDGRSAFILLALSFVLFRFDEKGVWCALPLLMASFARLLLFCFVHFICRREAMKDNEFKLHSQIGKY